MALETEKLEQSSTGTPDPASPASERGSAPEHHESRVYDNDPGGKDPKSLRSIVRGAFAEHKAKEREPSPARQAAAAQRPREEQTGKFAPTTQDSKPKAGVPDARSPAASTTSPPADGTVPATTPQASAAVPAPAALSKELKAIWDTLPATVQAEFAKREADTQKGVEQLKARYQPIDDAIAPYRPAIQQFGKTEAQAIKQLFDWHAALGSPNKVNAFKALAAAHGVDLSTLVAPSQAASQQPSQQDPNDFSRHLQPVIEPLRGELMGVRSELDRFKQERINNEIAAFSKDKPHFDKVRVLMGQMLGSGAASSLDDAYTKACRADPEVFEAVQNEVRAKQEADAKAAAAEQQRKAAEAETERKRLEAEQVAKARKAGVGPRNGTPAGAMQIAKAAAGTPVRDSIREAMKERGSRI